MPVLRREEEITHRWLGAVLKREVAQFSAVLEPSNWSRQVRLTVQFADGTTQALRLKLCPGATFGRSEVDYYTRDYVGLADPPLVPCYDAQYDPAVGYHLLLEDLATTHQDRRDVAPTLAYGLAVAEALGRLHRHHGESQPPPDDATWERYFAAIRPGVAPLEHTTGRPFAARFEAHAAALRARWSDPRGMTLLHGDLNSTNILTPRNADAPVYFLDRQPFDWSLTYGLAAYDLAYFLVLWWPEESYAVHGDAIVRRWWEALALPGYTWEQAQVDWDLSVEHCLHVPIEWCASPETREKMAWLWRFQLARVEAAMRVF